MVLDLISVASTVFLLHDVAGFGQIVDNAVDSAFGDAKARRNVAQTHLWVVGDTKKRPAVVGEECPIVHEGKLADDSGNRLPVCRYWSSLKEEDPNVRR